MRTTLILPLLGLLASTTLHANNIQVTNTTLVDNTGSTVKVQFDISWENSWRGGGVNNWDAAWVFVKYRQGQGSWQHVYVNPSGHTAPLGSLIEPGLVDPAAVHNATTNPVVGLLLRRDADGNGTFTANGVQLLWDYGVSGIAINDISQVQVFAVEMVYVNQGAFRLGSGGTEPNRFKIAQTNSPFLVQSEGSISLNILLGLWAEGYIEASLIPAAYPKGYNAFYGMKYEISTQQYVDFLNNLSRLQQDACTVYDFSVGVTNPPLPYALSIIPESLAPFIRCDPVIDATAPINFFADYNENGIGGDPDDGQWKACFRLHWPFFLSYLDWCGLRPMSEFEFEKSCRGPLAPIPDEYAWGTANASSPWLYTLANENTANERIATNYSTSAGNYWITYESGSPLRVGLFADDPLNEGRVSSGSGYYGMMDLTGNSGEFTVGVATAAGRGFLPVQGNGDLPINGTADVPGWPGTYDAVIAKQHWVSGRYYSEYYAGFGGGRGVRTAP